LGTSGPLVDDSGDPTGGPFRPEDEAFLSEGGEEAGRQKTIVDVVRKMLVSIYYMLKHLEPYDGEASELKREQVNRMRRLAGYWLSRRRRS